MPALRSVAADLARRSSALGRTVDIDPLVLLTERAAIGGLTRAGRTSCGGGTRLLEAADGWIAVSLARDDDVALVPAWLELSGLAEGDPWDSVAEHVAARAVADLEERAGLLGLPCGVLPVPAPSGISVAGPDSERPAIRVTELGSAAPIASLEGLVVADLGSLWAGPLCGSLLATAGAEVVKVESIARPDGARRGPTEFFDLLNAGKRSVALDLSTPDGRRELATLLGSVDVVIEASRPRALRQLGINAEALLRTGRPGLWVSITAHGRSGPGQDRVGFGDDVAVAAGLVVADPDVPDPDVPEVGPWFCADAVADPITGLVAATAALDSLASGGVRLLDVPMVRVAAQLAGPTLPVPDGVLSAPPAVRSPMGPGPELGADTDEVMHRLGAAR